MRVSVVRMLLVALTFAAGVLAASPPAPAAPSAVIQPGAPITTDSAECTLAFILDGVGPQAGRVFAATAAHCVTAVGDEVRLSFLAEPIGQVVARGAEDPTVDDWALVEIPAALWPRVDARVRGWPGFPKGVTTPADTALGDVVRVSGYAMGFDLLPVTREQRFGLLVSDDPSLYTVIGPIVFGDSGGPVVHAKSGKALGLVSRLCLGTCTEEGPTMQHVIAAAAGAGFPTTLRTV